MPCHRTRGTERPKPCHRTRGRALAVGVALALTTLPAAAQGQAIQGRVLDDGPVDAADVVALDTLGDRRATIRTDSAGSFELLLPEGGTYRVRVAHPAHDTVLTRAIEVGIDERVEVVIRLGGAGDTLAVTGRRSRSASRLRPYYDRLERYGPIGRGIFITREDLDSLGARRVGPVVDVMVRRRFRDRDTGATCRPSVYWNGIRMTGLWDPVQSEAARIPTARIEGIEVYYASRMELPVEYLDEDCGVILLWSRPGQVAGGGSTLLKLIVVLGAGVLAFLAVAN